MNKVLAKNPNAATAGVTGVGFGTLLVWLLGHFGVQMDNEVAVVVATTVTTVVLFIGKRGLRGVIRKVWKGEG